MPIYRILVEDIEGDVHRDDVCMDTIDEAVEYAKETHQEYLAVYEINPLDADK